MRCLAPMTSKENKSTLALIKDAWAESDLPSRLMTVILVSICTPVVLLVVGALWYALFAAIIW